MAAWPELAERVEGDTPAPLPQEMDLVVMNPPFTRDSLRYDQFGAKDERAVKDRESDLVKGLAQRAAARLHSAGGAFVVLADKMLRQDAGTMALVLPAVVPTAPGNLGLRQFLAQEFHVDTVVSSHDPERIYFSENTSIGEVLVICRRRKPGDTTAPTRVVNLPATRQRRWRLWTRPRGLNAPAETQRWPETSRCSRWMPAGSQGGTGQPSTFCRRSWSTPVGRWLVGRWPRLR